MPMYSIHIYRVMKLRFDNVSAATAQEAADKVCTLPSDQADDLDDCDGETFSALVDVVDDENYDHSQMIDYEPERTHQGAAMLLAALEQALPVLEAHATRIRLGSDGLCRSEAYDNALAAIKTVRG